MKTLKLVLPVAALGVLAAVPLCASAQDDDSINKPQIYIGGGAGYGRVNGQDFTGSGNELKKNRVGWKALAGIKFTPVLSLEGQYLDFGAYNSGSDEIKARGWTSGLVLDVPVNRYLTPYAKAGAFFWKSDSRFNTMTRDDKGTSLTYGLGVRFRVSDNIDLRTEYERFKLENTHVDNISASLQFNFGG
jgi:OOP family OmpA-OmpF porin